MVDTRGGNVVSLEYFVGKCGYFIYVQWEAAIINQYWFHKLFSKSFLALLPARMKHLLFIDRIYLEICIKKQKTNNYTYVYMIHVN